MFLSYTNPNGTGDPVLVQLLNGDHPSGTLLTSTILSDGATGFDTVTGKIEAIPLSDPDSMKLAPNGDLILTSGADGTIIDVHNAGTASQSVSFTKIKETDAWQRRPRRCDQAQRHGGNVLSDRHQDQ